MSKINRDGEANQRIVRALVDREVHYCVSSLADHFASHPEALAGSDYGEEDLYGLLSQENWRDAWEESGYVLRYHRADSTRWAAFTEEEAKALDDAVSMPQVDELFDYGVTVGEDLAEVIQDGTATMDDYRTLCEELSIDPHTDEALEHWIVSDWAAEKLAAQGEMVGELFGLTIWGRTCSGQAIHLDGVWIDIAAEMGILKGQQNEWSV